MPEECDISFEHLIDASGRNSLMATRYLRNRNYHKIFQNVALWGYWEGADRLATGREADIAVISIADSPLVKNILRLAKCVSSIHTETDYSYASKNFCGPGYFLVGDAACFLDPLLSSGVHLATMSAMLAAASISSLYHENVSEEEMSSFYETSYCQAYLCFLVVLSAFYDVGRPKESNFWEAQRVT